MNERQNQGNGGGTDLRPPLMRYNYSRGICASCGGRCCSKRPCQLLSTNYGGEANLNEAAIRGDIKNKEVIIDIATRAKSATLRPYGRNDDTEFVRIAETNTNFLNPCVHWIPGKGGGCSRAVTPDEGRLLRPMGQNCLHDAESIFEMTMRQPNFSALLFRIACEYRPDETALCIDGITQTYDLFEKSKDPARRAMAIQGMRTNGLGY